MKKLSKKFVQLSVVGTLLVAGGLFVAPQVQNLAAQASEPTKLVAFDQQANALGETINDVRESKTVTKTLAKAQETATKKQKEAQQKASQKVAETKVQVQNTATEQTSNDNQNAATTQTNEVTETTSINNTPNTNQAAVPLLNKVRRFNKVHLLKQHLPLKLIQVVLTLMVTTIQSLGSLVQVMSQQMVISIVGVKCQTTT